MKNQSSKVIYEDNENNLNIEDNSLNQTPSYLNNLNNSNKSLNPSVELNIDKLDKYLFLCNFCQNRVYTLNLSTKGKISYKCECGVAHKNLSLKEFFSKHLFLSKNFYLEYEKLKCYKHNEKYTFYCKKCESHFCFKCSNYCANHKNELIMFGIDDKDTKEKVNYINQKIKNKEIIKTNIININENDIYTTNIESQNNIENDEPREIENFSESNDNINSEDNYEIINKNESHFEIYEEDEEGDYTYINLFKIIIKNYENFPHYNLLKTISNIERIASLYFMDYNEIKLNYKFEKENIKDNFNVDILGQIFVNNNKEKCFLIIKQKIMELNKEINLKDFFDVTTLIPPINLDIYLIERKRKVMTNLSFMFNDISTITDQSSFDKYNTSNIKEMIHMFYNCKSKHLPESIKNFKTENVTDMNHMFYNCSSVKELPDISNWNTKNVNDMSFMFSKCSSLKKFPNISKWNTENVIDMSDMCEKCSSITSLPDISIWNIRKVKYMNNMFRNCSKLKNIPDFSKWEINENTEIVNMFEGDITLENKPEFRKKDEKLLKCCLNFTGCNCDSKYFFAFLIGGIGLLIFLVIFLYLLIVYFIGYFNVNNLDKTQECINNPIKYFNLLNNTNISYIAELKNITNESIIDEMSKNKELTIKQIINFTDINGNITFDSDYCVYKRFQITIKYIFFLLLLSIIFIIFNLIYNFKYIDSSKSIYLLIIIFFFNILCIFLHFKFLNITLKLTKSINEYFYKIIRIFDIKIPKINEDELDILDFSSGPIIFIIIISIINFIIIFFSCKIIHKKRDGQKVKSF